MSVPAPNLFGGQQHYRLGDSAFPDMSAEDVSQLWKALAAGSDIESPGVFAGSGFGLRIEWLDNMLRYTTFRQRDVKFFRKVHKQVGLNTVVEYNLMEDYGADHSAFIGEGDLPTEHDFTLSRNYARMKYLATLRRVTQPLQLLRTAHGDVFRLSMEAATAWLLRAAEFNSFFANSAVVAEEFDGIATQLETSVANGSARATAIKDLRGKSLTREDIDEMVADVYAQPNNGEITDIYYSVPAHSRLVREIYPEERYHLVSSGQTLTAGVRVLDFQTSVLDRPIMLNPDKFIEEAKVPTETGLGANGTRPASPTIVVQPVSPVAIPPEVSLFVADDAGTYVYRVVAENRFGLSAPVNTNAVVVAAGDVVKFTIQNNQGATGYRIYRTEVDAAVATATFIKRIPRGVSQQTQFVDENQDLPGTSQSFALQNNRESITWWQLLPMSKWNLAPIDLSTRWAQILYTTGPVLTAPRKNGMWKNVGKN